MTGIDLAGQTALTAERGPSQQANAAMDAMRSKQFAVAMELAAAAWRTDAQSQRFQRLWELAASGAAMKSMTTGAASKENESQLGVSGKPGALTFDIRANVDPFRVAQVATLLRQAVGDDVLSTTRFVVSNGYNAVIADDISGLVAEIAQGSSAVKGFEQVYVDALEDVEAHSSKTMALVLPINESTNQIVFHPSWFKKGASTEYLEETVQHEAIHLLRNVAGEHLVLGRWRRQLSLNLQGFAEIAIHVGAEAQAERSTPSTTRLQSYIDAISNPLAAVESLRDSNFPELEEEEAFIRASLAYMSGLKEVATWLGYLYGQYIDNDTTALLPLIDTTAWQSIVAPLHTEFASILSEMPGPGKLSQDELIDRYTSLMKLTKRWFKSMTPRGCEVEEWASMMDGTAPQ